MSAPLVSLDFANAAADKAKAFVLDQQMQAQSVAMGNLDSDQVSGILASALAIIQKHRASENEKREQSTRDILQLALLDYLDDLRNDITNLEAGFQAEFGDAWREELALRILGEDDIPQRHAGESIEDYRERLEKALMDEMLDENGKVKQHYRDDPQMRKYAEWAKKRHNLNAGEQIATDLKNNTVDHPQTKMMLDDLEEKANAELTLATADKLEGHEAHKHSVLEIDQKQYIESSQEEQNSFKSEFFKPIG